MSIVSGGGNYISDGAIMEWLAMQQDGLYADLRGSIDLSKERSELADELNTIKSELQLANQNKDFNKVDSLLQEFMGTYGGNPQFDEYCKDLKDMADTIRWDAQRRIDYAADLADYRQRRSDWEATNPGPSGRGCPVPPLDPGPLSYDDKQIEAWTNLIGGKLDLSTKNDQLTMIHIQQLKSTIDQGSQFASSFISSGDKTSSAIINNLA